MTSPISVVVIALNEEETIGHLLNDLKAQTHTEFEVVLVDSNSDDKTVEIATEIGSELPAFKVIEMEERGASLGRNVGAEHATHERLVFLDSDVRIGPDFLERAISALDKTGLKVAGGRMNSTAPESKIRWGIKSFDMGMMATQFVFPTAVGACIFSTRTVHQDIGGFNTAIKLCEDCDYVKRASRSYRFRMIPVFFEFDARRLRQDGVVKTGFTYLKANTFRLFFGELESDQIRYEFGHYKKA